MPTILTEEEEAAVVALACSRFPFEHLCVPQLVFSTFSG